MFMDDAATLAELNAHLGPEHPATRRVAASTISELMARDVVTLDGDEPPRPLTVRADTSMADATRLIVRNRINCLPVVAEGGKVAGIVTTTDFLRLLYTLQWWSRNPHS
jgi:CBS-domain-containing membrane protein